MKASMREHFHEDWRVTLKSQTDSATNSLRLNQAINTGIRLLFIAVAITIFLRLIVYVFQHADPMARELLAVREGDPFVFWQTLGAVTWPVLLLVILAGLCILLSLYVQSKGSKEYEDTTERISRLRREAAEAVPRARALTHFLEDALANAKRAFVLQLWAGRTLFLVGTVLLFAFVIDSFGDQDWFTLVLGVGSVGSFLLTRALRPEERISDQLGNVTQLEEAVTNYTRQVSILEEHVYRVMEMHKDTPQQASQVVTETVQRMDKILQNSVSKIQEYAEAKAT